MRFVKDLCWLQIKLLHRIHKESKRHHVRQRAQCILLSYQGYRVNELAKIFGKTQRTIYTWLNQWEAQYFAGLYDKKSKNLEIFYLPKSSPQLNLIEVLWRFMKYEWVEWRSKKRNHNIMPAS